ncbi:MAG: SpoIIE family protein phosphatase [Leptospira sp.]|nr:SpoIIE family protein phosphatase [Leptospira sp.]
MTLIILNSYFEALLEKSKENLQVRAKALSISLENSIKDRIYPSKSSKEFVSSRVLPKSNTNKIDELYLIWEKDETYFIYKTFATNTGTEWIFSANFMKEKILDSDLIHSDEETIFFHPQYREGISDNIENGFRISDDILNRMEEGTNNKLFTILKERGKGQIIMAAKLPSLPFQVIVLKSKSNIYSVILSSLWKFFISFFVLISFVSGISAILAKNMSAKRKEQSKLESLLKNLPLGAILVNSHFEPIIQNDIMKDLTFQDPTLWNRISNESQFRIRSDLKSTNNYVWEIQTNKNWEVTLSPWFGKSLEPEGYSIVLRDLTAKKVIFEQEMEMAKKIQEEYLPNDSEEFDGVDFKAYYKPYMHVGGDYYDYLQLEDNKILFVMADVVGHGLQAAMMMTVVKILFLQTASTNSPEEILTKLNVLLKDSLPMGKSLVPLHFLILNTDERTFKYANAGHPGAIFIPDKGNIEFHTYERLNPVLGFYEGWNTEIIGGTYSSNSRFFLYTDGLTDVSNLDDDMLGTERVNEFVISNRHLNPTEFTQKLEEELMLFSQGKNYPDDITWFVIDAV